MSVYEITKFGTISMDKDGETLIFDKFSLETDENITSERHKYIMLMAIIQLLQEELHKEIKYLESIESNLVH